MAVNVFAVHGFLGQADDWNELRSQLPKEYKWHCPELFSKSSPIFRELNFEEAVDVLTNQCIELLQEGPLYLIGYSLGGRLLMHAYANLLLNPFLENDLAGVFLSTGLGINNKTAQNERLPWEEEWHLKFAEDSWEEVIVEWNQLEIFNASPEVPQRSEQNFDRQSLANSLIEWSPSLHDKECVDRAIQNGKVHFFVGGEDSKYLQMHEAAVSERGLKNLNIVQGAGHRLHIKPQSSLVTSIQQILQPK